MQVNIEALKRDVNLAGLIERDLGPASKRNGRWLLWRCPFHDDREPSLAVTEDNGRWHCFGCGESGDAITWLQKREGLSFKEACQCLGAMPSLPAPSVRKASATITDIEGPPSPDWQERAQAIVDKAADALWTDEASSALDYLHRRGFTDETLRRWRIGYTTHPERGILIPCYYERVLWEVKLRRPKGNPKYKALPGSKTALFGAETLPDHQVAVLAEGMFDAMLLEQEVGDLVGVATSTAPMSNWRASWTHHFLHCQRILVAYDTDAPGERHAQKLLSMFARARRMAPPIRPPEGKDITDYYLVGGDLRAWIEFHLARQEAGAQPARTLPEMLSETPSEQEAIQTPQMPPSSVLGASDKAEAELSAAWEAWYDLEERIRQECSRGDPASVEMQASLIPLRLQAAQLERKFYEAEKRYKALYEDGDYVTLAWPAGTHCVTIGGKWRRLRSGEIEASYARGELELCLAVMHQAKPVTQQQLFGEVKR